MTSKAPQTIENIVWHALAQQTAHIINCTEHDVSCVDFTDKMHTETVKAIEDILAGIEPEAVSVKEYPDAWTRGVVGMRIALSKVMKVVWSDGEVEEL